MANYENTYWNAKGRYSEISAKVSALVPASGEVGEDNPALEKYRKAANCYYDLYNNGLCNRKAEFRRIFGFASGHNYGEELTQALVDKTENALNAILLVAAREQGIPTPHIWEAWIGQKVVRCESMDGATVIILEDGRGIKFCPSDEIVYFTVKDVNGQI